MCARYFFGTHVPNFSLLLLLSSVYVDAAAVVVVFHGSMFDVYDVTKTHKFLLGSPLSMLINEMMLCYFIDHNSVTLVCALFALLVSVSVSVSLEWRDQAPC